MWGPRLAVLVWLGAMACTAGLALVAATWIDFVLEVALVLAVLLGLAVATGVLFLRSPDSRKSKRIENVSGVWTLGLYLILGAVPLCVRVAQ
jgi:4-hydroxybenzoate polyprenyltransferase